MQNLIRFPISQQNETLSGTKGWSYLLADSLAFNKQVDYGIRIQKPNVEKIPQWIAKIITSGQCKSIYVENLRLAEKDQRHIRGLCHKHNVSLYSVSLVQEKQSKVVKGPW